MKRTVRGSMLMLIAAFCTSVPGSAAKSDVIDDVQSRVVKIFGAGGLAGLQAYGTGFLCSADGHIVTAFSHVLDTDTVTVVLSDGRRLYAKVLGTDVDRDVAVLKVEADGLPYFDLSKAVPAGPGTRVLAFSNMFKVAAGNEPVTVQRGVISAKSNLTARRGRFEAPYRGPVYVVDAVTNNPGSAGGVLTTLDGRLIAILGRELKNSQSQTWLNYAVPIGEIAESVASIQSGEFRPRDRFATNLDAAGGCTPLELGIVLVPDVVARTPAYIDDVLPESQAARAGLAAEDLVVFVNSDLVGSIASLEGILRRTSPGDDVQFTVRRGDDLVSVTLRIPEPSAALQ
ncbi:MAG: trypsin-like peptidase domain-containing protein [Planctomyces sp.]|nr:trypsin-like peptidase domain-containing protein [Planctomyces sp.]